MAYAASLAVAAILLLALYLAFVAVAREVPEDREHEVEVKLGPARIRRKVGKALDDPAESENPTEG